MTGIAKDALKRIVSPQSLKYCGFTPERRTRRDGSTGERAMSNWATMRDIEKDKPRVSDIFTRKPYGAANDLGKILRKKRRKAIDHERYIRKKERYLEEHSEEEWREAARGKNSKWRDANRDKLHEQQKRYREKHKDELRERRQEYYQANKERIKARIKANYYKRKERDESRRDNERLTESKGE